MKVDAILNLLAIFLGSKLPEQRPENSTCHRARGSWKIDTAARHAAISEPNWLAAYTTKAANLAIDDLTRIEGIGPKVCALLIEQGITRYSQLARVPVDLIRQSLRAKGQSFAMIDPQSWPAQAALAANGQWDALQSMQRHLVGGRRRGVPAKGLRLRCLSTA